MDSGSSVPSQRDILWQRSRNRVPATAEGHRHLLLPPGKLRRRRARELPDASFRTLRQLRSPPPRSHIYKARDFVTETQQCISAPETNVASVHDRWANEEAPSLSSSGIDDHRRMLRKWGHCSRIHKKLAYKCRQVLYRSHAGRFDLSSTSIQ
jgi:hypothetical protein